MKTKVLLVADGDPDPRGEKWRKGRFVVALDGAADQARKEGWRPDRILGDFDAVKPATLAYFAAKKVEIRATPDQDHTDLEKALALSIREGGKSIWVCQALGGRVDHSLANLAFLKRFHRPGRELLLLTATERIRFVRDQKLTLKGKRGRGFAIFPFPACVASSKGLAYELSKLKMELGLKMSVSNQAARAAVQLSIKGEALVIEAQES